MKSTLPLKKPLKPKAAPAVSSWLRTANYTEFNKLLPAERFKYAAVRTTRGAPRFPLKYNLAGTSEAVMPPKHAWGLEADEFESTYRSHLDALGVEVVARDLTEIKTDDHINGGTDRSLVLLCFCKLGEVTHCHRRIFAQWWQEQTGESVPELTGNGA